MGDSEQFFSEITDPGKSRIRSLYNMMTPIDLANREPDEMLGNVIMMLHTLTLKREIFTILGGFFGFILPFFFFMSGYNYRPGKYTFAQNVDTLGGQ